MYLFDCLLSFFFFPFHFGCFQITVLKDGEKGNHTEQNLSLNAILGNQGSTLQFLTASFDFLLKG